MHKAVVFVGLLLWLFAFWVAYVRVRDVGRPIKE
jgi:hypothetical protein